MDSVLIHLYHESERVPTDIDVVSDVGHCRVTDPSMPIGHRPISQLYRTYRRIVVITVAIPMVTLSIVMMMTVMTVMMMETMTLP